MVGISDPEVVGVVVVGLGCLGRDWYEESREFEDTQEILIRVSSTKALINSLCVALRVENGNPLT